MFAVINKESDVINCLVNYLKLGGEIDSYIQKQVETANKELSEWMSIYNIGRIPQPTKRKYTRRNLNPELGVEDNNTVKIYCEGTCSNIGKSNATAGYGIFCHITVDGEVFTRDISEKLKLDLPQSNQRAELEALYHGIVISKEIKNEFPTCSVEIIVSSLYVHRCIYEWADIWKKKEWKGVKHSDILSKITEEIEFPCKLISKDSNLGGYKYARMYSLKSVLINNKSENCEN